MDKYEGMKKVETVVRENREVKETARREKRGVPHIFKQFVLACIFALLLFTFRLFGPTQDALQKVKEAVAFDAVGYAQTLFMEQTD